MVEWFEWYFYLGLILGGTLGIAGIILVQKYKEWRYPIRTPLLIQRGKSGIVWDLDARGRHIKKKDGYEAIQLNKYNDNIKVPKNIGVTTTSKGKPVYPIYQTVAGQYYGMSVNNPLKMEVIEDTAVRNWSVQEQGRLINKYQEPESTFLKLAPYLVPSMFVVMLIFFMIYYGGKMEIMGNTLAGAAGSLEKAMTAFTNSQTAVVVP